MEQLEWWVAIQFLNREPLETPVSKYGTIGTLLASGVYLENASNYHFLIILNLERMGWGVFLHMQQLEPLALVTG